MKVESCTGIKKCAKHRIDKKLKNHLKRCNFEGTIKGDPDSKVSLVNCEKGASDISIVSEKANLDNTNYRVHVNGTLEKGSQPVMDEESSEVRTLYSLFFLSPRPLFKDGADYSLPKKQKKGKELTYVDRKGNIMTLEMISSNCCRPHKKTCNKGKDCRKRRGNFVYYKFVTTDCL